MSPSAFRHTVFGQLCCPVVSLTSWTVPVKGRFVAVNHDLYSRGHYIFLLVMKCVKELFRSWVCLTENTLNFHCKHKSVNAAEESNSRYFESILVLLPPGFSIKKFCVLLTRNVCILCMDLYTDSVYFPDSVLGYCDCCTVVVRLLYGYCTVVVRLFYGCCTVIVGCCTVIVRLYGCCRVVLSFSLICCILCEM